MRLITCVSLIMTCSIYPCTFSFYVANASMRACVIGRQDMPTKETKHSSESSDVAITCTSIFGLPDF